MHSGPSPGAWTDRAKLTLRALGSSQLAYRDSKGGQAYGSFDQLLKADYVQAGYTRGNMIDNYSIAVFYGGRQRFQIIALPRSTKNRLRTYVICEDQVVRVATAPFQVIKNRGNEPPASWDPCSWEPFRD